MKILREEEAADISVVREQSGILVSRCPVL